MQGFHACGGLYWHVLRVKTQTHFETQLNLHCVVCSRFQITKIKPIRASMGSHRAEKAIIGHAIVRAASVWVCVCALVITLCSGFQCANFQVWCGCVFCIQMREKKRKKTQIRSTDWQFMDWAHKAQLVIRKRRTCSGEETGARLHANAFHLPHCANTLSHHHAISRQHSIANAIVKRNIRFAHRRFDRA